MEQRVARLESDVAEIKGDVRTVIRELADIKAEFKHLPTKGFVITTVIAIVGLVMAAIAVAPYLRVPT